MMRWMKDSFHGLAGRTRAVRIHRAPPVTGVFTLPLALRRRGRLRLVVRFRLRGDASAEAPPVIFVSAAAQLRLGVEQEVGTPRDFSPPSRRRGICAFRCPGRLPSPRAARSCRYRSTNAITRTAGFDQRRVGDDHPVTLCSRRDVGVHLRLQRRPGLGTRSAP